MALYPNGVAQEHQWVMGVSRKVAVELKVHRGALATWAVDGVVEEFGADELRRDWGVENVGEKKRDDEAELKPEGKEKGRQGDGGFYLGFDREEAQWRQGKSKIRQRWR